MITPSTSVPYLDNCEVDLLGFEYEAFTNRWLLNPLLRTLVPILRFDASNIKPISARRLRLSEDHQPDVGGLIS